MSFLLQGPSTGQTVELTVTASNGEGTGVVASWLKQPLQAEPGIWTVQSPSPGTLRVTVLSLPADAQLFEVEYVSASSVLQLQRSTGTSTLDLNGLAQEPYTLRLRGVGLRSGSREVFGDWSETKTETPQAAEEPPPPPATIEPFTSNQWSVDATGVSGELEVALNDLPVGTADVLVYVNDILVHTFTSAAANNTHTLTSYDDNVTVAVSLIARMTDGTVSDESDIKLIAPFVAGPPVGTLWPDDDWLLADMRNGTLAINILNKTPGETPKLEYQINGGAWIRHPSKASKLGWYELSGTTVNQSAAVRARLLNNANQLMSETNVKTATPTIQDFPSMLASDWALTGYPCTSGDLLAITPLIYEDYLGWTRNGFDIEVTDSNGTRIERLRMGAYLNVARRYRVIPGQPTSMRMRRVYTSNVDDTVKTSPWSPIKAASPQVGAASFSITSNLNSGIAPANFFFEIVLEGTPLIEPLLDTDFAWTFDDPGIHTRMDSSLPWDRDRNIAYGPAVGHVYPNSGSYIVTCIAYAEGELYVATRSVSVTPFTGTTVTVGSTGDHATLAAAISANPTGNLRCLFERGQTHEVAYKAGRSGALQFGPTGTGNDPILSRPAADQQPTMIFLDGQTGPFAMYGLQCIGPHDVSDPFNTIKGSSAVYIGGAKPSMVTIYDCFMSGWNETLGQGGGGPILNAAVSNTEITNWFNFGIFWEESGWITIEGCMFRQDPLVYNDPGKGDDVPPFVADHGPHRMSRPAGPHSIQCSWFTSHNTWSGDGGVQPTLRWNTGGAEFDAPNKFNLDRFLSEGGGLTSGPGTTGARVYFHWVVMDKFIHVSSHGGNFNVAYPGQRVRNFVIQFPASSAENSTGIRNAIGAQGELRNGGALVSTDDCKLYNGTVIDLRNDTQSLQNGDTLRPFVLLASNIPSLVQIANLVAHVPNGLTGGTTADAPLDLTGGAPLRYLGRRITFETNVPFSNGVSRPSTTAAVTGAVSGATGSLTKSFVSSGRFNTNDAVGFHTLANVVGTFQVGEDLLVGGNVVGVVSSAPFQGTLTLTGNAGQNVVIGRPLAGSPAIGSATLSLVAHRDIYGAIRGDNPSRGAAEPLV